MTARSSRAAAWLRNTLDCTGMRHRAVSGMLVLAALAGVVAHVVPHGTPVVLPQPRLALAPQPVRAAAVTVEVAADHSAAVQMVSRFALNALLATLIDDAVPPRWTDAALHHVCGPATRVEVDGQPLVPGALVPATAFSLRWQMDECWPFDAESVLLSGAVGLLVFHEDVGMSAVVDASRMTLHSADGDHHMVRPFAAALGLAARTGEL